MKEKLFAEFPEVSAKSWKQKIQHELKGADYNENLIWESPEGVKVKPFYHRDDLKSLETKVLHRPTSWKIAQEIFTIKAASANVKALNALRNGAESLIFILPSKDINLKRLLANIDLDFVDLHFKFQFLSTSFVENLLNFLENHKSNSYLNIDTIGNLARTGNWFVKEQHDQSILREILDLVKSQENRNVLSVDVGLYQNAGANIIQELAYALGHANEYLNLYGSKVFETPVFKVSVGGNYFFEIAKLRALRWLWHVLASEYGSTAHCHIVATPSKRNKTLYGYNTNMLRTTTESMSAILGGSDTINNLPYDSVYHKDNEFAERMARNQLLLLQHESGFKNFDDPAAGSYYIEILTEQIAEKALLLFKNIEAKGGFLHQLKNHTIQRKIRESAQKELQRFEMNEEILVGSNLFDNAIDKMKDTIEIYPFVRQKQRKTFVEPVIEKRLAEGIERKRLKREGWK